MVASVPEVAVVKAKATKVKATKAKATKAKATKAKVPAKPESFQQESTLASQVVRVDYTAVAALVERGQFFTARLVEPDISDALRQRCRRAALTTLREVQQQGRIWALDEGELRRNVCATQAQITRAFAHGDYLSRKMREEVVYISEG